MPTIEESLKKYLTQKSRPPGVLDEEAGPNVQDSLKKYLTQRAPQERPPQERAFPEVTIPEPVTPSRVAFTPLKGFARAGERLFGGLDALTRLVERETGLRRGGTFEDIAQTFGEAQEFYEPRAIPKTDRFGPELLRTLLEAGPEAAAAIAQIGLMKGLIPYGAGTALTSRLEQEPEARGGELSLEALKGGAGGALMHGLLGAGQLLPRGARVPALGGLFAAPELIEQAGRESPQERNFVPALSDALVGGALSIP